MFRNLHDRIVVSDSVPEEAINLIWNVFFLSRGRGISPEIHFPWISNRQGLYCVRILKSSNESDTIATLIVKRWSNTGIGLIGLVCVKEGFRKLGLSTQLLKEAITEAKKKGFLSLVLWTTKPRVYEEIGFQVDATYLYGTATSRHDCSTVNRAVDTVLNITSRTKNQLGIPAFAQNVIEYSSNFASITVCTTAHGETLIDYFGSPSEVSKIIYCMMPKKWEVNAELNSPIIKQIESIGFNLSLNHKSVRMSLNLSTEAVVPIGPIQFLERI